jgi:hypothetical protein
VKTLATESGLTGRVTQLHLTANSFEDERILKMIFDGLVTGGTLFELTKNGQHCGSFTFDDKKHDEQ